MSMTRERWTDWLTAAAAAAAAAAPAAAALDSDATAPDCASKLIKHYNIKSYGC